MGRIKFQRCSQKTGKMHKAIGMKLYRYEKTLHKNTIIFNNSNNHNFNFKFTNHIKQYLLTFIIIINIIN